MSKSRVVSNASNPDLEKWIALCQASTIRPIQLPLCDLLEAGVEISKLALFKKKKETRNYMKQNSAEQQPGVGLYIGVCQTLAGAGWD